MPRRLASIQLCDGGLRAYFRRNLGGTLLRAVPAFLPPSCRLSGGSCSSAQQVPPVRTIRRMSELRPLFITPPHPTSRPFRRRSTTQTRRRKPSKPCRVRGPYRFFQAGRSCRSRASEIRGLPQLVGGICRAYKMRESPLSLVPCPLSLVLCRSSAPLHAGNTQPGAGVTRVRSGCF